ncbi:hypothetical protein ACFFKE_07690 [Streptomyces mutabilis]|uniref:hypothetical protein n=1 Tax=Streptomyces mutabilis TaxID=67332 RepID=UPI0017870FCB|nr:hypothetical protein [Streptomyces mutabilis]GGQ20683.1 hypothetical protein GCM10010279_30530 [Streptomyces mutabilis]
MGWAAERTQQFLTLMIDFNHGIEQLEARVGPRRRDGHPSVARRRIAVITSVAGAWRA